MKACERPSQEEAKVISKFPSINFDNRSSLKSICRAKEEGKAAKDGCQHQLEEGWMERILLGAFPMGMGGEKVIKNGTGLTWARCANLQRSLPTRLVLSIKEMLKRSRRSLLELGKMDKPLMYNKKKLFVSSSLNWQPGDGEISAFSSPPQFGG